MFMFRVAKHIARKMAIKRNFVLQNPLSTFTNLNCRLIQQKIQKKMTKKAKKGIILGSKTPKNDLLTLNNGLPSSFTTLST